MDEFLEKFNSTPLGQKILIFAIILAGLFVVYYFTLYGPLRSSYAQAQKKYKSYQSQLKEAERKLNNQVSKEELLELQTEFNIIREKLPSKKRVSLLIKKVNNKAKTAGLEIQNFEKQARKSKNIYVEIPMSMELKGTYGQLVRFLDYVRDMSRIVHIEDLTVELADRTTGELEISARATTYRYKQGGNQGDDKDEAN